MRTFRTLFFLFTCVCAGRVDAQIVQQLSTHVQAHGLAAGNEASALFTKPLSSKEASEVKKLFLENSMNQWRQQLDTMWKNRELELNDKRMKFEYKVFGEQPADGRSLFISMHGGGNTAARVNDQQWKNQIGLYRPEEGIYLAPRAPTNTWNLWHEEHIDSFFHQLILGAVLFENVNPAKVYLMGYSAGGDGVYQLAPRLADRLAAASMMAGHPNETTPESLRNIGFALHMGGNDSAYRRNAIAREWKLRLDSMSKADPGGYKHHVEIHEGKGHWMGRQDSVAVPWMSRFKRNPIPSKVVWKQDDVHHPSFYWLAVPARSIQTGGLIIASYNNNTITIDKNYSDTLIIRLNDEMVNLDWNVRVIYAGKEIFGGKVSRTADVIRRTVLEKSDPGLVFNAEIVIVNGIVVASTKK